MALRGMKVVLFVVDRVGAAVERVVKIRSGRFLFPNSLLLAFSVVGTGVAVVVVLVVVVEVVRVVVVEVVLVVVVVVVVVVVIV